MLCLPLFLLGQLSPKYFIPNLLSDSGNSSWDLVNTQWGGVGRGAGGVFKWERTWANLWLTRVDVW